jgi:hypothetical protein
MIVKSTAGAIALALLSPALISSSNPVLFGDYPLVKKVTCDRGTGTAFRIGRTRFLSVDHVTRNTGCKIDGVAFWTQPEPEADFSVLEVPIGRGGAFKVSCEGFKRGQHYWAIGWAGGRVQRVISLYSYGTYADNGMAVLIGSPTVIPGMSGGPVINERGEVVGTVNMYNPWQPISLSRALRDTGVCKSVAGRA